MADEAPEAEAGCAAPAETCPTPDEIARSLSRSTAWSTEDGAVQWLQTHISHVFLVADRVFKLRKAVRMPFLDFGSRRARNEDCQREVILNRRLADGVYLGIAPVLWDGNTALVGPVGESPSDPNLEHVVVMRRLPEGRDALSLVESGRLEPRQLESVAALLSRFHAAETLGTPAPWSCDEWFERTASPVLECTTALRNSGLIARPRLLALETRVRDALDRLRPRLENRRAKGCAVDAHGDLHLDHVWFETDDARPLLIDCIEFNEDLRRIDSAAEVSFLAMDLRYRDRADLAEWFLASYASWTDDYDLYSVVDFFASYRALVRAKVAALAASQTTISETQRDRARTSAERHLRLAETLLEKGQDPALVLLCGTVGSGKSSVGRALAKWGLGVPIVSDRVRKILAGIPVTTHFQSPADAGIYQPENTEGVYRALLDRATAIVNSGRTAILDASFSRRAQRESARTWAVEHGIPAKLIEVRCDPETARSRLEKRARSGTDPSDAGPDFLPISLARFEAPDEWPKADFHRVRTDGELG